MSSTHTVNVSLLDPGLIGFCYKDESKTKSTVWTKCKIKVEGATDSGVPEAAGHGDSSLPRKSSTQKLWLLKSQQLDTHAHPLSPCETRHYCNTTEKGRKRKQGKE